MEKDAGYQFSFLTFSHPWVSPLANLISRLRRSITPFHPWVTPMAINVLPLQALLRHFVAKFSLFTPHSLLFTYMGQLAIFRNLSFVFCVPKTFAISKMSGPWI